LVFYSNCSSPNSSPQFSFSQKNHFFPTHSILATYLISTTVSDPNRLSAQLARMIVFHPGSIKASSDSGCRPPLHTATPLHPLVTPPCGKQEPPRVLLSPPETSAAPSFILLETEVSMYRRKIFGLVT
jgi:hypothetical protein